MRSRRSVWTCVLSLWLATIWGCSEAVPLEDTVCPCLEGFRCCEGLNRCVPETEVCARVLETKSTNVAGFGGSKNEWPAAVAVGPEDRIAVAGHFSGQATFGDETKRAEELHDLFVGRLSANGDWQWVRTLGADSAGPSGRSFSHSYDEATSVVVDAEDHTYVGGRVCGPFQRGSATADALSCGLFVAKLDAGGGWLWARAPEPVKLWGGGQPERHGSRVTDIALRPEGGVFVLGRSGGWPVRLGDTTLPGEVGGFLGALDSDGQWLWVRRLAPDLHRARFNALAVDSEGYVFVAGMFRGNLGSSHEPPATADALCGIRFPSPSYFVARLDGQGGCDWITRLKIGLTDDSTPYYFRPFPIDLAWSNALGAVFVAGTARGTAELYSPAGEVEQRFAANVAGTTSPFVASLERTGRWRWVAPASPSARGCRETINTFLSGATFDQEEAILGAIGETEDQPGNCSETSSVAVAADGSAYLTGVMASELAFGDTRLPHEGGLDAWIARIDGSGRWNWAIALASDADVHGTAVSVRGDGNPVATGAYQHRLSFAGEIVLGEGKLDGYVGVVVLPGRL